MNNNITEVSQGAVEQAVPAGYKQTEVGVIPEDWSCINISEVCSSIGDGIHATPIYSDNGPVFFVNGNNLSFGKIAISSETKRTSLSELSKHSRPLTNRSVLISINGTIGNLAFYNGENIILGKSAAYLNIKQEVVKEFIYYCLSSNKIIQAFHAGLTGSTIKNLGLGVIRNTCIPLPSPEEQTAIANALSDMDALLDSLEALIAKKQVIKTATMQQLLTGRTRLPQFAFNADGSKKGSKSSELGEIPEDWNLNTLNQLATIKSGGTPSTAINDYWDGNINWCTPTDITALRGKKYLSNTSRKITEQGVASSAAEILPSGAVIMTSRATIGECAIAAVPMATNQGFKNFLCGDNSDNEFLYYLLSNLTDRFISLCSGSTFLEISTTQVRSFNVAVPPKLEQTAIATILSDMDEELQALEQQLSKTRQLKQGMMQQLLTGKVRLVTPA